MPPRPRIPSITYPGTVGSGGVAGWGSKPAIVDSPVGAKVRELVALESIVESCSEPTVVSGTVREESVVIDLASSVFSGSSFRCFAKAASSRRDAGSIGCSTFSQRKSSQVSGQNRNCRCCDLRPVFVAKAVSPFTDETGSGVFLVGMTSHSNRRAHCLPHVFREKQ